MSAMLGKNIAGIYPAPLRWIYRLFGFPNIHDRQRWAYLWPRLRAFRGRNVRLLDVGCGSGSWVLELAAANPDWTVTGIDRNADQIRRAEQRRESLGLRNAGFVAADYVEWQDRSAFDIVLSVNSAHYALPAGRGPLLFQRFREWLAPSGVLILFAPWCGAEGAAGGGENHSQATPKGFVSTAQISGLCDAAALRVDTMAPCIGRLGILAKGLAIQTERRPFLSTALYPAQLALSYFDRQLPRDFSRSAALILTASPTEQNHGTGRHDDSVSYAEPR
jgi:SAM-dependent methyltransferase